MKLTRFLILSMALVQPAAFAQISATKSAPGDWSSSYDAEVVGPTLDGTENYTVYHYFNLKRNLPIEGYSFAFVGRSNSTFGLGESNYETVEGDHYLKLYFPSPFESENIQVLPQIRVFAPASQGSQEKNRDVYYNPRIYVTGSVGKVDLTYGFLPYIYTYKKKSEEVRPNYSIGQYLLASYNVGDYTSLDLELYPCWTYYNKGPEKYNGFNFIPGVTQKITKDATLSLWVDAYAENTRNENLTTGATISVNLL